MKILIVEDDVIQSTNLKYTLSSLGVVQITVVNNSSVIQSSIADEFFDLAFCDLRMPDVDGISLLYEHLNKDRVGGVVIMSVEEDVILQLTKGMCNLLDYRFVEVLPKPFDSQRLSSVLERYVALEDAGAYEPSSVELTHSDIFDAFAEDRIFVLYQPQYDFHSGAMVGVEALVRMVSRDYVTIPPDRFLPLVASAGLLEKLYIRVLEKSTQALGKVCVPLHLSVNVNQQLLQKDICDLTIMICKESHFPLERLTLELTEEEVYNATPIALANLARLRLHGIQLSIDDFGTGYASLEQLVDLPFTELKIDRLFISKVLTDYRLQQLTKMILNLAQSLSLSCVAEGVEDKKTWEYLKDLGVDICQGYYTGKPMHINDINDLCWFVSEDSTQELVKNKTTMVLLDDDGTRRKALGKLLEKSLPYSSIVAVQTPEESAALLRDLPVSYLMVDGTYSTSLLESEWLLEAEQAQEMRIVFLIDSDSRPKSTSSVVFISKSSLISETTQRIVEQVKKDEASLAGSEIDRLSKREMEVAKLLLAGFTNKYISYELGINPKTVSTYKTRVLEKLGVRSTIELSKRIQFDEDV